jgi:hypothetical protein
MRHTEVPGGRVKIVDLTASTFDTALLSLQWEIHLIHLFPILYIVFNANTDHIILSSTNGKVSPPGLPPPWRGVTL